MLRQVIKLAIEAVKVEVDHWLNPTPAGTPVEDPADKAWSPATNVRCIACAAVVDKGCLVCARCDRTNVQNEPRRRPTRRTA